MNRNGQIKLHIVKVFDNDGMWTWASDLIKAVETCVAEGSTVINMSLGGGGSLQVERDAYDRVYNQNGVLLVASAGNSGSSAKSYPASYPAVLSVGAVNKNNQRASFSQYNNQVDLCAPGVAVKSTVPGGDYSKYDGVSFFFFFFICAKIIKAPIFSFVHLSQYHPSSFTHHFISSFSSYCDGRLR